MEKMCAPKEECSSSNYAVLQETWQHEMATSWFAGLIYTDTHFCSSSLIVNSAMTDSTLVALNQQDPLHGKVDDDKRFGLHYRYIDGGLKLFCP